MRFWAAALIDCSGDIPLFASSLCVEQSSRAFHVVIALQKCCCHSMEGDDSKSVGNPIMRCALPCKGLFSNRYVVPSTREYELVSEPKASRVCKLCFITPAFDASH